MVAGGVGGPLSAWGSEDAPPSVTENPGEVCITGRASDFGALGRRVSRRVVERGVLRVGRWASLAAPWGEAVGTSTREVLAR